MSPIARASQPAQLSAEIVIVGSGAGGGMTAYALSKLGADVLILERGGFMPREEANWSPREVVSGSRYRNCEPWEHEATKFRGSNHYYVGGMTTVFGGTLDRFRPQDLDEYGLDEGASPAWPITYDELEPFYAEAERIWGVRGDDRDDPMAPPRSAPFPFPPLEHEPAIAALAERLRAQGLHPYSLSMGVNVRPAGQCVRSKYCDGFPCPRRAKCDAETRCISPALEAPSVRLQTGAYAERLITDRTGRSVIAVEARIAGELVRVTGRRFVISAGAANSAALFLRSSSASHPHGLANRSGQVGSNYIHHTNSAVSSIAPWRVNSTVFQKTLGLNDFYLSPDERHPRLGSLQLTGRLLPEHVRSVRPRCPYPLARWATSRSIDWWLMTEDVPLPENRVLLSPGGGIRLEWKPTSVARHRRLVANVKTMMRRAGYPVSISQRFGLSANAHQAGTLRFGQDPTTAVVDPGCKVHHLENVWVIDASVVPSLGAGPGGPTLTIAALALRTVAGGALTT